MELRLMKENIQMEQPVGAAQSQAVVEGEITLPGGLREEAHVLAAQGMALIESVETMQDRASVTGKVVFHALYTQGDPEKVHAIEAGADFTHLMELPGAAPRNQCIATAQIEHIEASAHNGRMSLRAVMRLQGRTLSQQPVEALTGLTGIPDVEMKTRQVSVKRTVGSGTGDALLREEFALPAGLQIRDTLYATAMVQLGDVTGGLGRVGLSGTVQLEAIHASDMPGKPVVITRHTLPFEQSIDLTGESGDALEGAVTVKDVAVVSQDAGEGERTLRAEVLLGLSGWSDRKETVTVLSDAYTTGGDNLHLTTRDVRCRVEDNRAQVAESGKLMLMLPEGAPAVRGVLAGFASPVMTNREQHGGRLTVEGMLEVTLLYMTDDSAAPVAVFQEEPFRVTFAAQAGDDDSLALAVGDVDVTAITSDRVEMKYIMHLNVSGHRTEEVRLVTDAQPVAAPAPDASIVLYFTQPGESLWDIARRYRVPVKEVRELNPELTGEPKIGQGVVVWHRCNGAC